MKRIFTLLLAVSIIVILNGCKKDNKNTTPAVSIVGKWYVTAFTSASYKNDVKAIESSSTHLTTDDYMQFNADGTGVCSISEGSSPAVIKNFKYTVSGSTITTADDVSYFAQGTANIITLTSTSLVTHETTAVAIIGSDRYYGTEDATYTR